MFWWLIISAGSVAAHGGLYVLLLMWCPAVSALSTRLVYQHNVRGEGWTWKKTTTRWAIIGYVIPLVYASVAYGSVWLTGLGRLDLGRFSGNALVFVVAGTLQNLLSTTGEELGWRGFLVPTLARTMSFGRTAFLSGIIWAAWHVPIIVGADYNAGTPMWYAIPCFALMVVSISFPLAWLRLRTGSVWPAAIFHASHNLYIQGFFDRVTVDTGPTRWLTTEFGAAVAVAIAVTAWIFWRRAAGGTTPPEAQRTAQP
ncbi:MAG TPA: CPBP family intramembrane glutamic endopeptidase [Gemmatimonadaceae bacterium]